MNNEEMFQTILNRMDKMETGLNGRMDQLDGRMDQLDGRMDQLDGRMDQMNTKIGKLETDMKLEFYAVRVEMDMVYNSLNEEIRQMNDKIDKLMFTKDVEGYDKIDARFKVLEQGYRDLKKKIVVTCNWNKIGNLVHEQNP